MLILPACGNKEEKPAPKEITPYATVNGEVIMSDEIDYFKTRCRADIINEYAEKYSVKDFSDFWDKEFDGTTPAQALEKKALSQAVDAKIRLVLMRDNGVYDDISFSALKEKAEKYNKDHENVKGNVGINSIDLSGFYTYYVSTGEMELKNILAEGELKPTEDELALLKEKSPDLTDEGLISVCASEKYDKMIEELIKNAKTEMK